MSTSTNGTGWSGVTRIPIDPVGSGINHVIPGLAVDKAFSGSSAHLGLAFYFCSSTCQLQVGFVSSTNGGATWTAKNTLTSTPMPLAWLANTSLGRMVGDYISTSFSNGHAFPVFAVATAPSGSTFNEAMFTVVSGLTIAQGTLKAGAFHARYTYRSLIVICGTRHGSLDFLRAGPFIGAVPNQAFC